MKKALSLALALVMALSLSVCAFATNPIESLGGSDSQIVKVNVTPDSTPKVYNVTVAWGDLTFTYNFGSKGTWNPNNHSYTDGTSAGWDKTSANITVTNHSNAKVNTTATFAGDQPTATNFGVTASITGTVNLATAEGTEVGAAPSGSYTVTVSGTPNEYWAAENNVVGTITVKISAGT